VGKSFSKESSLLGLGLAQLSFEIQHESIQCTVLPFEVLHLWLQNANLIEIPRFYEFKSILSRHLSLSVHCILFSVSLSFAWRA